MHTIIKKVFNPPVTNYVKYDRNGEIYLGYKSFKHDFVWFEKVGERMENPVKDSPIKEYVTIYGKYHMPVFQYVLSAMDICYIARKYSIYKGLF